MKVADLPFLAERFGTASVMHKREDDEKERISDVVVVVSGMCSNQPHHQMKGKNVKIQVYYQD